MTIENIGKNRLNMESTVQDNTNHYTLINRELSTIAFNKRVLELAKMERMPLLERLRYISIVSSNLDEFFEVRVAGVKRRLAADLSMKKSDGITPRELLSEIRRTSAELVQEQYQVLNELIFPSLREKGVYLWRRSEWSKKQREWIKAYFEKQVFPVLTPLGLDPAHPIPNVENKSLNFILSLKGKDAFGRESTMAILPVPRCLPRIIALPDLEGTGALHFVLLSSVIHAHTDALFPGMKVKGCYQFRVTRNADMFVDEEEVEDLLKALKGQLHGRNFGEGVRLEISNNCPPALEAFLAEQYHLDDGDIFRVDGLVNAHRLGSWVNIVDRPDLKFGPFSPGVPSKLEEQRDILSIINKEDFLLHHPYRSFDPVVEMAWRAVEDPNVLAIKMTLYRVGSKSSLIDALVEAARHNKDVTAVVELRARFDEADNIHFAQRLIQAGVKVVYGIVGYKCHAKLMLLVRREDGGLKRYAHIGTGNYHVNNARLYTDYSLLTSNPEITEDVHKVFMQLTGLGKVSKLKYLYQSPFTLFPSLRKWIAQETAKAKKGEDAWIIAKMNSLSDETIIRDLYAASQAGVKIRLLIRGICCLRPGIKGLSENIEVRSILGRMLEHHRAYAFSSGDVYIASSDWMERNLHRRVEVCCPILNNKLRKRILFELESVFWKDNQQSWRLLGDGRYERVQNAEPKFLAQQYLMDELGE